MDGTGSTAKPVAWRTQQAPHTSTSGVQEDNWRVYNPAYIYYPWNRAFAVGMALLAPEVNEGGDLEGSARVFMFGYGQDFGPDNANGTPKTYIDHDDPTHSPRIYHTHYSGLREQYSPYLLWDPSHIADNQSLGILSYLDDPNNGDSYAGLEKCSVLHCVGMCMLEDGTLFMTGGERNSAAGGNVTPGLNTGWLFSNDSTADDPFGYFWDQLTMPEYTGTGGYYTPYGGTLTYYPNTYTAISRRYYPTCITLPSGKTMTVGGDTGKGRASGEGPLDSESYDALTYLLFDFDSYLYNGTFWESYATDSSHTTFLNDSNSNGHFSRKRFQLGTEYPRLHVISSGKVVCVGQTGNVWELDASDPSTGWDEISTNSSNPDASKALQNKTDPNHPNDLGTVSHLFAPSVLLPSHNTHGENSEYLNPSDADHQALDRVAIFGGADNSTLGEGNYETLSGYTHDPYILNSHITDRVDILDFTNKVRYIKEWADWTTQPTTPTPAPYTKVFVPSMPNDDITKPLNARNVDDCSERAYGSAVLLPDGKVFVTGGFRYGNDSTADVIGLGHNYTSTTFLFDPNYYQETSTNSGIFQLGQWTRTADVPSVSFPNSTYPGIASSNGPVGRRMHHSGAMLLPNGLVLTAGTTEPTQNPYPTLFTPPILLDSNGNLKTTERPKIERVDGHEINYGTDYDFDLIFTYGKMNTNPIVSVVMMRPSACTHSLDTEQRLVRCHWQLTNFDNGLGSINITPPWSANTAPPGWYMIFLVAEDGTYSEADWVHLTGN